MALVHEVLEGPQQQHSDEVLPYAIDVSEITSTAASPVVTVYDEDGEDVTTDVLPTNSPIAAGGTVTTSPIRNLEAGKRYRVEVAFTDGTTTTYVGVLRLECIV